MFLPYGFTKKKKKGKPKQHFPIVFRFDSIWLMSWGATGTQQTKNSVQWIKKGTCHVWYSSNCISHSQSDTNTWSPIWFADLLGLVNLHGNSAHTVCSQAATWWAARCIAMHFRGYVYGVFEWRCWQIQCSQDAVLTNWQRSGCTYTSAASPRQSTMHGPRICLPTSRVCDSPAEVVGRASCTAVESASICRS